VREREPLRLVAEEHAADLRGCVLQREVEVAGRGARAPGRLTADPCEADVALEPHPRVRDEARNGDDRRRASTRRYRVAEQVRFAHCIIIHDSTLLHHRSIVRIEADQHWLFVQDKEGRGDEHVHLLYMSRGVGDERSHACAPCRTASTGR